VKEWGEGGCGRGMEGKEGEKGEEANDGRDEAVITKGKGGKEESYGNGLG